MAWLEENATMWETMASKLVAAGEPEMAASTNGEACFVRAAIALLDAGRKDRERVNWLDAQRWVEIGAAGEDMQVECEVGAFRARDIRAAIDKARGA